MPTIQIVKNGPIFYPLDEENYNLAKTLSPSLNVFDQDTFLLASCLGKPSRVTFEVQDFDGLEDAMLTKLQAQFSGAIVQSPQALVFTGPRSFKEERLETLITKLKAWYKHHHLALEVKMRRSNKSFKLTLTKTRMR